MITSTERLAKLNQRIRLLAVAFGLMIAVMVPLGYWALDSEQHRTIGQIVGNQAASRIAQYAYLQGPTWEYGALRLATLLDPQLPPDTQVFIAVDNLKARELAAVGKRPDGRAAYIITPIISGGERIGDVRVHVDHDHSLTLPLWVLLGLSLGVAVIIFLELLPMRALRRSLSIIGDTQRRLQAQVTATDLAYEDLQRNHREAEETADALSRAVRQAEIANRTKTEFLANISHELRTPLNAIIGFSEILKDEMRGSGHPSYKTYAKDIHDSGTLLLAVINDILDLSKIEAGRQDLNLEIVPPMQIVRSCATLVRERALAAGVKLAITGGDGLEDISADPIKLKQVLLNLLSNAVKFTPRGGVVAVEAAVDDAGELVLSVIDTGPGISVDRLATIFDPFQNADSTQARDHGGSGLGLAISKKLMDLHGGALVLKSRIGHGTTGEIRFPARRVVQPRR